MTAKLLSQLQLPGGDQVDAPQGIPTATSGGTIGNIVSWSINILLIVAILGALFFLIWGGISWITSGGDREKLDKARKTIIFAIIGLIVVLLSFIILQTVGTFLGIDLKSLMAGE
ncbi:MAG TPA: hypothetical protein PLD54_01175 [Candidatus Levybacteria bacterium]|nr:hypothetical protein [Candidatus Levybacteria bacterium]